MFNFISTATNIDQ